MLKSSSFLYKIYKELKTKFNLIIKNFKKELIMENLEVKEVDKDKLRLVISSFRFASPEVQKSILKSFNYEWKIKYREIELIYYTPNNKLSKFEEKDILDMIICILLFKSLFNRPEKYKQKVTFYPTSLPKLLPKTINKLCLGPHECNSGLTFVSTSEDHNEIDNGDIILFRKEEHIKVLIHEMIHSNFRDLLLIHNQSGNKEITNKICTDYDILLNESYTEFIATILNIFYIGVKNKKKLKEINDMLKREIEYSIKVANKILRFYGINNIDDILKVNNFCKKHLSQKTNVISYYLFKPLQFIHLNQMEEFLKKYTQHLQIINREGAIHYKDLIFKFINEHPKELFSINKTKNFNNNNKNDNNKNKSLRMTLYGY